MHLVGDISHGDGWAISASSPASDTSEEYSPLFSRTPELSSFSTSSSENTTSSAGSTLDRPDHSHYISNSLTGQTPRGSRLLQLDYRVLLSLQGRLCPTAAAYAVSIPCNRDEIGAPANIKQFKDLTLADIESLNVLPGASGRRQSTAYRFRQHQVIKVSPHSNVFYEARMLAHIKKAFPSIPVPRVYGTRQLRDARGHDWHCMLMEYVHGVRADEALHDWSAEETITFMNSVQALQRTLAAATAPCIQAVDTRSSSDNADVCEVAMIDCGDNGGGNRNDSVQDELFDHIWQAMDRGPFASEAAFLSTVVTALQRRGAGNARLGLVSNMLEQLPALSRPAGVSRPFSLQHANLTLGNLLVRQTAQSSTPEIVAVLVWGQSGFYPAWWELAKMAASEDRIPLELAVQNEAFPLYSQHVSVMLHVRDIIY